MNINRYTNGRRYRRPQARLSPSSASLVPSRYLFQTALSETADMDWPTFWKQVSNELRSNGYQLSTLRVYRQILRSFRDFINEHSHSQTPSAVTGKLMNDFLWQLTSQECSWSWVSVNISVIRTAFDKLGGLSITAGIRSPKRKHRLPNILSPNEVERMISAAPRARDKLLIGLMYYCGLKVSEVANLRWEDVEINSMKGQDTRARLNVSGARFRQIALPTNYNELIVIGKEHCAGINYIFPGREKNSHLSTRTIERIVKKASSEAEIPKIISCMTLRHSYAVACLKAGENILQVQLNLGHKHLETTERYQAYIPPSTAVTPHPQPSCSQIDTAELGLPFQSPDDNLNIYTFLRDMPGRLLLSRRRKGRVIPCNSS